MFAGKRVAIYARYSSQLQRESSIEDQVRRCVAFIVEQGGSVDKELVFSDAAVSGSSLQRPGFEKLMRLAEARPAKIDTIVTEDMSRMSRDFADSADIFRRLNYARVQLVGVADGSTARSGTRR
jgi:DNA invertase Pin-like site-specific DNA recombinase